MGPDKSQAKMLEGAFTVQSYLFGAIATGSSSGNSNTGGNSGGLTALRILGGLAVMVGALLFVFNNRYWRPDIIASWLLLVIVVMFAPFGSKLLFYRVPHTEMNRGSFFIPAQAGTAEDCKDDSKGCGFTAQVLAIDIANRLQVTISDIFRSQGWRNLINETLAREKLKNAGEFSANANWLQDVERFNGKCGKGTSIGDIIAGASSNAGGAGAIDNDASKIMPQTMGEMWDVLRKRFYGEAKDGNISFDSSPPPTMVLYGEEDLNKLPNPQGYVLGLNKIFHEFVKGPVADTVTVKAGGGGSGTNTINVDQALRALKLAKFFEVVDPSAGSVFRSKPDILLGTGFFFATKQDALLKSSDENTQDVNGMRFCYYTKFAASYCKPSTWLTWGNPTATSLHQDNFKKIDAVLRGEAKTDNKYWSTFAKLYRDADVRNMPVGEGRLRLDAAYTEQGVCNNGAECTGVTGGGFDKVKIAEASVEPGLNCKTFGSRLLEDGIKQSFVGKFSGSVEDGPFGPAAKVLLDGGRNYSEQLKIDNILSKSAQGDAALAAKGEALKDWWNGILRDVGSRVPADNSKKNEILRSALVQATVELIVGNTREVLHLTGNLAESGAQEDATRVRVGGMDSLTSVGGTLAVFFGKALTGVGAFFSGPLAQAFVAFVTIIVQLSIMVLIAVTPFLFVAGLVIPTAAMGVMTTAVVGAFVLQFVPVTLIILNYLGGFVYDVVGVTGGGDSWVMQNLIIIAMSGLYMSAVGMTFFLLFKLGDPAAVLGRMASIDGAAKDMADRGLSAAGTAATIAAGMLGAGAAGGFSAMLGKVKEDAIDTLNNDQLNAFLGGMAEEKGKPEGPGGASGDGDPANGPVGGDGMPPPFTDEDKAYMDEQMKDEQAASLGMTRSEYDAFEKELQTHTNEYNPSPSIPYTKDGQMGQLSMKPDKDGNWKVSWAATSRLNTKAEKQWDENKGPSDNSSSEASTKANAATDVVAQAEAKADAKAEGEGEGDQPQTLMNSTRNAPKAGGGGGSAVPVMVEGGRLDELDLLKAGTLSQAAATKLNEAMENKEVERRADELSTLQEASRRVKDPATRQAIEQQINDAAASAGRDDFERNKQAAANSLRNQGVLSKNSNLGSALQEQDAKVHAVSTQLENMIKAAEQDMKNAKDEASRKVAEALRDRLAAMDPIAWAQGEEFAKLQNLDNQLQLHRRRGGADRAPGIVKSMFSGMYGSAAGLFAGAGSIPILGPALRETLNEWQQAPERARAWSAMGPGVGGFAKWMSAKDKAARMGFYQKEVAPIVAGHQYDQTVQRGAFQAQVNLGRQAATEAVEKSRSGYEALMLKTGQRGLTDSSGAPRGYFAGDELRGLGRIEALSRVNSVIVESAQMKTGTIPVMVPQKDASGKYTGKWEEKPMHINKGMAVLDDMYSGFAAKQMASTFDDNLIKHYGIFEKRFFRGKEWIGSRHLNRTDAAINRFVAMDYDTDYLVGGHIKMVEGKAKFYNMKGQYETLVSYRNQNNIVKESEQNRLGKLFDEQFGKNYAEVAQNLVINAQLSPAQAKDVKAVRKAYVDANLDKARLPFDSIIEESYIRGLADYKKKSRKARRARINEAQSTEEEIAKDVSKEFKFHGVPPAFLKARTIGSANSPHRKQIESVGVEMIDLIKEMQKQKGIVGDQAATVAEDAASKIAELYAQLSEGNSEFARDFFKNVRTKGEDVGYGFDKKSFQTILDAVDKDRSPSTTSDVRETILGLADVLQTTMTDKDGKETIVWRTVNPRNGSDDVWVNQRKNLEAKDEARDEDEGKK